ncbi:hypothetical protein H1R20_g3096, partial [Candolleomyces eurysporus]
MNVSVPPKFPDEKQNLFKRMRAVLKDFQVPLWYDKRYRSLPFIPLVGFFDDLMCAPLRRRMETEEDFVLEADGRWAVPKQVVAEWLEIEKQRHGPAAEVLERTPCCFFVRRTKEWFLVLFSYATWLLSENHVFSNPEREQSRIWTHLIQHVDPTFLRCFVNSTVLCISAQVPRVGCFFDLASYSEDVEKTARQLHRFIYNSIPVWFPLNETTWELLKSRDLRLFRPPSTLLDAFEEERRALSVLRGPLYKDRAAVDAWRKTVADGTGSLSNKPVAWQEFFERRDESNRRRLQNESDRERQRRRDREKFALTGWSSAAGYYKWVWDDDEGVHHRTRLNNADIRVEMVRHAPAQRRFDAFANEWDICTDFGSGGSCDPRNQFYEEGDSDLEEDGMEEVGQGHSNPGPYTLPDFVDVAVEDSPLSLPPTPERQPGFEHTRHLTGRMAARLPFLFGLSLESITSTVESPGQLHQKHVYRALGGENQPRPFLDVPVNGLLYQFFISIIRKANTGNLPAGSIPNFDLDPLCPALCGIIMSTVTICDGVFVVKPSSTNPCLTIVVYHAEAAIFCCRLENRSFESMALALFKHGICFNCCVESTDPAPAPSSEFIFPVVPPVVSADSNVDKAVYDGFVESRRLFLVGHRRRAALLRGVVGRIAREVIGSEAECERLVLQDPSPFVLSCSDNIVADLGNGTTLFDDVLAVYEVDYILAAHLHLIGDPSEYKYRIESWWPRSSVMESDNCNSYHWYWDDHNEHCGYADCSAFDITLDRCYVTSSTMASYNLSFGWYGAMG